MVYFNVPGLDGRASCPVIRKAVSNLEKIMGFKPKLIPEDEQKELISVVVPVYNIDSYLKKCVNSIRMQTYHNLQIILVDDGATDNSPAICDAMAEEDSRIQVIHKKNGGLSDARNAGIELAEGEYITFVDGDDWIEPGMYENMLSAIKYFNTPICICRYKQIFAHNIKDDSQNFAVVFEGQEALESFLMEEDDICIQNAAWNKLYRRELMGELRFPTGKYYEDIVYTTRLLARSQRTVYLDLALYNYVLEREGSIMGEGLGSRIFTDQIPAYDEKEAFLRSIGREDLADVHRYFFYKRLLLYYIALGKSQKDLKDKYRGAIRERLLTDRGEMDRVYACRAANPKEKKKMEIFLKSPKLYLVVIMVNERFLIPMKQRLRRH